MSPLTTFAPLLFGSCLSVTVKLSEPVEVVVNVKDDDGVIQELALLPEKALTMHRLWPFLAPGI